MLESNRFGFLVCVCRMLSDIGLKRIKMMRLGVKRNHYVKHCMLILVQKRDVAFSLQWRGTSIDIIG